LAGWAFRPPSAIIEDMASRKASARPIRLGFEFAKGSRNERNGGGAVHVPMRNKKRTRACIEESARQARQRLRAGLRLIDSIYLVDGWLCERDSPCLPP